MTSGDRSACWAQLAAAFSLTLAFSCSSTPPDANGDSGTSSDSGIKITFDGGMMPVDAGDVDAGESDSGVPFDAGPLDAGPPPSPTQVLLTTIAAAMRNFHHDTGGWPLGNAAWYGSDFESYSQILPGFPFASIDLALFYQPPPDQMIPKCSSAPPDAGGSHCWFGPYLPLPADGGTASLDAAPWLDPWGHACLFAYIRPDDGHGGGIDTVPSAANGLIFLWSMGPDGLDGFTCSDNSCELNQTDVANEQCSMPGCDDIIVEVAMDSE